MRKKCLFVLTSLSFLHLGFADIRESTPVGPGVIHHHEYRVAGPWHFQVLEIDLTNPWLHLQTAKANDLLAGYEKTSAMAKRHDQEGHRVVGAINGDFYLSGGIPTNAQVCEGVLLNRPIAREVFGCAQLDELFIAVTSFTGKLLSEDNFPATIHGINEARGENQLIVYNKFFGDRTQTNYYGTEITTHYITNPIVNDTVTLVVTAKDSIGATGHGNNLIPKNGVILSGHGTMKDYLDLYCFVGDTIRMLMQLTPVTQPIRELIGGNPTIIRNGIRDVPDGSFSTDRHPRTAVGFNQDTTKLYFFVVDGRQPGFSVGMSLYELADYMLEWNVYRGVNLDGGGSSTMVVRNQVKNSPSDAGGERSVANALLLVSTAPTSPLNHLRITPRQNYLLYERQQQFALAGFDEYWNNVAVPAGTATWACDSTIGSITATGLFSAASDTGSGWVWVTVGDIRDSVSVHVTTVNKIIIEPSVVVLKVGDQQQMTATAYEGFGNIVPLNQSDFTWTVLDSVGTISASGLFTALVRGNSYIKVSYRNITDSVIVQVGGSASLNFDDFSSVAQWSLTGTRVDLSQCSFTLASNLHISPATSGKLHYYLTTGGTSALYLNCAIPISGEPTSFELWVYGDGRGHWLRSEFTDRDNEKFLVDLTPATPGVDWTNSWRRIEVQLKDAIPSWANPSAVLNYPIKWTKIYLAETADTKKDTGTIYLDDFVFNFIETGVAPAAANSKADKFSLVGHFPNPFNNFISFLIDVFRTTPLEVTVYNLNGEAVDHFVLTDLNPGRQTIRWQPISQPSGIYFFQFRMGQQSQLAKCVMLK